MNRACVLLPLMFACSEQDLRQLEDLPYGWSQPTGERVRVQTFADVRFRPGGPIVASGGTSAAERSTSNPAANWFDVAVVDDTLGLVVYTDGAELLLFTDRSDATTWTVMDTAGGATSTGPSNVSFAAGTALQILDNTDEAVQVRYRGDFIDVEVWLPVEHVDQVLDIAESQTRRLSRSDQESILVHVPVALYDAPGGAFLGELTENTGRSGWQQRANGDDVHRVDRLAKDQLGYAPIEVGDGRVRVTAWIEVQDIADSNGGVGLIGWGTPFSIGCGVGGFFGAWPVAPKGTAIYDEPEGRYVGEYVEDTAITDLGEPDPWGWTPITFQTDWGPVQGWIEPDGYEVR